MFGQARKIIDLIGVAHDVVQFEGVGSDDAFDFSGRRFVRLRLLFPLGPWLGEEFSLGCEVTPDMFPLGVPGPDQFVGVRNDGF